MNFLKSSVFHFHGFFVKFRIVENFGNAFRFVPSFFFGALQMRISRDQMKNEE